MKPIGEERDAIEAKAAEWLARRDRRFTADEAVAFACWREADPRHAAAVAELERVWTALDGLSAVNSQGRAGDVAAASPAPTAASAPGANAPHRRGVVAAWWPALGLAAAFVLLAAGWWVSGRKGGANMIAQRFETSVGGRQIVPLADGSEVQLNTNTSVTVSLRAHERGVTLERGEAFFRVARNEARPFVVTVGRVEVRVLGTAFAVRLREAETVVLVKEGEVRFGVTGRPGEKLHARQQAFVAQSGSGAVRVETLTAEAVERRLAWQVGHLEFVDTPLGEAVAEFNRYHRQRLLVPDPATAAVPIGGRFEADNLEAFLRLLELGFDMAVIRRNQEEIVLGLRP